ncbi:hypothetical protein Tco_0465158 [Tanacetum coccineum]
MNSGRLDEEYSEEGTSSKEGGSENPLSYSEALSSKESVQWKNAIIEEIVSLEKNQTCSLVKATTEERIFIGVMQLNCLQASEYSSRIGISCLQRGKLQGSSEFKDTLEAVINRAVITFVGIESEKTMHSATSVNETQTTTARRVWSLEVKLWRFAPMSDVNDVLSITVILIICLQVREYVLAKTSSLIAPGLHLGIVQEELFGSNDYGYKSHYLEEARKKTQERNRNSKPSVMHTTSLQNTTNGSKPNTRSTYVIPLMERIGVWLPKYEFDISYVRSSRNSNLMNIHLNDVWTKQFKPRSSSKDVWTKQFNLFFTLDDCLIKTGVKSISLTEAGRRHFVQEKSYYHAENPEVILVLCLPCKNLDDSLYTLRDQNFFNDKLTKDDQEKSKVIEESDSTIPDPSHQTVTSTLPVIAPFTDVYLLKPSVIWSLLHQSTRRGSLPTIITPLPEITPFISLQLRVARLEQEMSEVKKTDHSTDVLASIKSQVPTVVDKYLGTKLDDALLMILERHTADLIEQYSALPGLRSEDAMDKEVAVKVKDHKEEKHDSDDEGKTMIDDEALQLVHRVGQQREEDPNLSLLGQLSLLRKMITKVQRNHGSLMHLLPYNIQLLPQLDGRSLTKRLMLLTL